LKIEVDVDAYDTIDDLISKNQNKTTSHIQLAIEDSFKRLLNPAISNETLQEAKSKRMQFHPGFATNLGYY
jgi:uncharacterized protein